MAGKRTSAAVKRAAKKGRKTAEVADTIPAVREELQTHDRAAIDVTPEKRIRKIISRSDIDGALAKVVTLADAGLDADVVQTALNDVANASRPITTPAGALDIDSTDEVFTKSLREALDTKTVSPKGPLQYAWEKHLKASPDQKKCYAECKGWEAKSQFRLAWADRKLQTLNVSRTHCREYQKVDTTKGVYLSFGMLVESFGIHFDREGATKTALRHASKCIHMGGRWTHWDGMAECTEFLKLNREFANVMTDCWRLCEEETSTTDIHASPIESGVADEVIAGTVAPHSMQIDTHAGKGKGKSKAKGLGVAVTDDIVVAKKRNKLDESLAESTKVKSLWLQAMNSSKSLLDLINVDEAWAWARSASTNGKLKADIASLEAHLDSETRKFILDDVKTLKVEIGAETLLLASQRFNDLRKQTQALWNQQKGLMIAHKTLQA
jgi:hypothetical protein